MLRDILKHTERAGLVQEIPTLQEAIYVMKVMRIFSMNDVRKVNRFKCRWFQKLPTI